MTAPANPTPEKGQTPLTNAAWERIAHGDVPEHEQLVAFSEFADGLERDLDSTKRRLAEVEKERDDAKAMWVHWQTEYTKASGNLSRTERAAEIYKNGFDEAVKQRDAETAKLTSLSIIAARRAIILGDVLSMAAKAFSRDRGHVCESRKAVEAIAQTINARKDSGQDELAALRNAADGLIGLIANQPHDITCRIIPDGHGVEPIPCDCWKSKASPYAALISEGAGKPTADAPSEVQ